MSINTENATTVVANEAGNTVEPVEAPKKKGREKQTVPEDNAKMEMLKHQIELQQQQIAALLNKMEVRKKPPVCCSHSFGMIDKSMRERKELRIFKLKKEADVNGYRYVPFMNNERCGDFVIVGKKTDNVVIFSFKKIMKPDLEKAIRSGSEKAVCSDSGDIIHSAKVSSNADWVLAEIAMINKFNSTVGRLERIVVGI